MEIKKVKLYQRNDVMCVSITCGDGKQTELMELPIRSDSRNNFIEINLELCKINHDNDIVCLYDEPGA